LSFLITHLLDKSEIRGSHPCIDNKHIVGHILFSGVVIETEHGALNAVSLAPMAVLPECQRQGIGSELVRRGLQACRERGKLIVFVLGDPEFYIRFGFSVEMARWLQSPYSGDCWMAIELVTGALDGVCGVVRYPEAFEMFS
jgi:putative acetyltransferase